MAPGTASAAPNLLVIPAKAGTRPERVGTLIAAIHLTFIPAKAGIHLAVALARHSREGGNPGTFHAFPVMFEEQRRITTKLPIACGARVTFLCLSKEK
ncbi:hypothetical protein L3D22_03700 [Lysobacter soli]|uniref:hypothetical protein n=1 Tax=Lysobacter soli TaxID=453783 RepID=UPI0020A22FB2|nr:hypothetical protein [Lysobacter soli]UTA54956.1 hypothetical protein L3D22_03700 [Lysobacter soli]